MKRDPTDQNGDSQVVCDRRAALIIRITSWSGIVVGSVQTLLIGLALLIIAALIAQGTRITAAGIVLAIGAFVNYCVVVAAARGLGRYRRWGLWAFGILQLLPLMAFFQNPNFILLF